MLDMPGSSWDKDRNCVTLSETSLVHLRKCRPSMAELVGVSFPLFRQVEKLIRKATALGVESFSIDIDSDNEEEIRELTAFAEKIQTVSGASSREVTKMGMYFSRPSSLQNS